MTIVANKTLCVRCTLLICCIACAAAHAYDSADVDTVTVVGTTALPGSDVSLDKLAGNFQSVNDQEFANSHSFDATEFFTRKVGSAFANDAQGNPLQHDLQVRGFVASPLLGSSQGISVFQDGVRVNEPFGDTVNWALIPDFAIGNINLLSGSNALFGLNTLGAAILVHTKNGFTHAGVTGELGFGSARRMSVESTAGGVVDQKAFFIGASHSQEDGWRDFSPTRATQVFADARYRNENSEVNLSLTYANTDLIGNGPAPDSLIAVDRRAIFTQPDRTRNTLWMLSTGAKLQTGDEAQLTALIYQRRSDIKTLNGDASAYDECGNLPGFVCQPGTNQVALDQNGVAIIFTPQVDGGALNRSDTEQVGRGVALQWVSTTSLQHRENHFVIGASIDHSDSKFGSNTELGSFDATRAAIGSGEFASDAQVGLKTSADNYSVFFSDTFSISQQTAVTAAGRYFRQSIGLRDQLGTELNGDHRFSRFNPSLGIATQIGNFATAYASYAESSRTPSPVELTCANPGDPCRLPNAFLTDPPLDQVIAKTFEAGLRGKWKNNHWHIGAFRTINHYDIIFVSAGALTNEGYFTNVRATQRQGIEVLIKGATNGKLGWFLNYTFLDATFQDDLQIASANNPLATNGVIDVHRGDRLPSAPRHLAKLGFDWDLHRWLLSADVHYASSQFARGDEANLLSPLPAYVVVNAQIGYRFTDKAALDLSVRNVFDNDYATFATFGQSGDVLGTAPKSERFSTPAAPRSVWIALRVGFN